MKKSRNCIFVLFLFSSACLFAQRLPIITVLDLNTVGVSLQEMKSIVSLLSSSLFQTRKYTVIDTAERDTLMKEIEFSSQECTDEACQIKLGKLLSAEYIVVGNLNKVGTRFILTVKMLETGTSRTVSTADGKYATLDELVDDLDPLAKRIAGMPEEKPSAAAPKPATPAVPVQPAKPLSVKSIASLAGIVAGVAVGGVGGYFLYEAFTYLSGPVETAFKAYDDLPTTASQSEFDSKYGTYTSEYQAYQSKLITGALVAGGGVALLAGSIVFLALPEDGGKSAQVAAVSFVPRPGRITLSLRVSW
jgi:hypothetical protein